VAAACGLLAAMTRSERAAREWTDRCMSAPGHERRFRDACDTSAYPPRADVNARNIYLAYGMVRQHSRGRGAQSLQGGAQSLQEVRAMTMAAANWQGLIREPELRLSTLAEAFQLALVQQPEIAGVTFGDDLFRLNVLTKSGKQFPVYLNNLFADASRAPPDERAQLVKDHLANAIAAARRPEGEAIRPRTDQLVPTVKGQSWIDAVPAKDLAFEHIVADLFTVYAFDEPQSVQYARWADLEQFGLDRSVLRQTALENLRRRLPPKIGTRGDGKSFILTAGGNYEASLILLDDVWDQLAPTIAGDIIACVLARDICLVTGTKTMGGLESLLAAQPRVCARALPSYFVSRTLIRKAGRTWSPLAN